MNNTMPPSPQPQPLCAAFAPLLPLLNAGELDPEQAASLRDHLATCAWCRAQLAGYDALESAARRHYAGTPAATPLFQVEEIEKMLDEPTAPVYEPPTHPSSTAPPATPPPSARAQRYRRRTTRRGARRHVLRPAKYHASRWAHHLQCNCTGGPTCDRNNY